MTTTRARLRGTKSKRNVAGENFAVILLDSSLPGQKLNLFTVVAFLQLLP